MSFPTVAEIRINESGEYEFLVDIGGQLRSVGWAALPGSQASFLACPDLIVLLEGGRGTGKTIGALMDFCQFVGIGLGAEHKGVFLRRTFPELSEVISLSRIWIPRLFPNSDYNKMDHRWTVSDGATLTFSYILDDSPSECDRFMGHSYTWICMDELTSWPNMACFRFMLSTLRSAHPKAVPHMRALTNPFGVGRQAVMDFFHLPLKTGTFEGPLISGTYDDEGNEEPSRRTIHGDFSENLLLDDAYMQRVLASTDDPSKKAAWARGEWAAPSDSLYQDIFVANQRYIEVADFDPPNPNRIRISYDHGSAAPACALFWYEADGEDIPLPNNRRRSTKPGDLFLLDELYLGRKGVGLKLSVQETAARIKLKFDERGWPVDVLRRDGNICDSACWNEDGRPSIASDFDNAGVHFIPANKGPGSRAQGTMQVRKWLMNAAPVNGERAEPGLFVCTRCTEFWKQIPHIQRSKKDPETAENEHGTLDHLHDALCYWLLREKPQATFTGSIAQFNEARRRRAIR